jgi:outer membrane autotransporter protein
LLATIALVAAVSAPAQAQVQTWVDATGNWIIGTNWAPAGTPTPATDAQIDNGGTAQITGPASANSLTLGSIPGGSGTVTIGAGGLGILKTTTGLVGSQSGSQGAVDVSGAIASWTNTGTLVVGSSGTGTLTIQNRGTVTDGAGFIGNLPGGLGTVMVTGAGSSWSNAGSVVVGGLGTGALTIQDGGTVNSGGGGSVGLSAGSTGTVTVTGPGSIWNNSPGGGLNIGSFGTGTLTVANGGMVNNNTAFTANIGNGAGSQGTATVTGAGSIWSNSSGVNVGNLGTGTLTIADSGVVAGPVTIATNAGSIGTLNIGAGAGNPAAAPGTLTASSIAFGAGTGTINFNHTSTNYVFAPAITGNGTVNVLAGITTLTGANTYSGATNVNSGTLRAGVPNTFSPNSPVTIASGGTLDLNGFSQTVPSVTNAGLVNMGTGTAPGTLLTTTNYVGAGGTIAMNTFLGGDGSPSDKLVINGGTASGNSSLRITNAGGPGAVTTGNGILVVDATNGTTAPGAFALAGPVVAGPFEYKLFRGAPDPVADSWFLRSTIDCAAPGATSPPCPPAGSGAAPPNFRVETSLYAAIPSLALLYGRNLLDTLHERVGEKEDQRSATGLNEYGYRAEGWGRFIGLHGQHEGDGLGVFGSGPDFRYDFLGVQAGRDVYRRESPDGTRDQAGLYFAYGTATSRVTHFDGSTGDDNFTGYTLGGYWTHFGAPGWYIDAVAQGTYYDVHSTANRGIPELTTHGPGFGGSLEGGYPFHFAGGYFIEPQAQLVYQHVGLSNSSDIGASVRFDDVDSLAGRIGARFGRTWALEGGPNPRLITAWLRPNFWYEFLGNPKTEFSSADGFIPFRADLGGPWFELNAGVSGQIDKRADLFASVSYQTKFNDNTYAIAGKVGVRMLW